MCINNYQKHYLTILFIVYPELKDVTNPMIGCISIALVLWLLIGLIYFRKINYILRSTPKQLVERTLLMNSAYPIVATASVASLLVPSAMVIGDSVCHLTFAMLGYQFFQ